jgi:hypothetical protein
MPSAEQLSYVGGSSDKDHTELNPSPPTQILIADCGANYAEALRMSTENGSRGAILQLSRFQTPRGRVYAGGCNPHDSLGPLHSSQRFQRPGHTLSIL